MLETKTTTKTTSEKKLVISFYTKVHKRVPKGLSADALVEFFFQNKVMKGKTYHTLKDALEGRDIETIKVQYKKDGSRYRVEVSLWFASVAEKKEFLGNCGTVSSVHVAMS